MNKIETCIRQIESTCSKCKKSNDSLYNFRKDFNYYFCNKYSKYCISCNTDCRKIKRIMKKNNILNIHDSNHISNLATSWWKNKSNELELEGRR